MAEAAKTKETITLEEARRVIDAAERKAEEIGDWTILAEWYADGLRVGTDPASPNAWPRPDRLGQANLVVLGQQRPRPRRVLPARLAPGSWP